MTIVCDSAADFHILAHLVLTYPEKELLDREIVSGVTDLPKVTQLAKENLPLTSTLLKGIFPLHVL